MMKKILDEMYPAVGFKIDAKMIQTIDGKWFFEVSNHIQGPDDVITKRSQVYNSKKHCLHNFISSLPDFVQQTLADL